MSKQTELAQVADTITVNSGNVGIGTSTPHDLGSSFAVLNLDGSNGGAIAFSEDDNATDQWLIYTNSDDSLRFAYGSNYATEAMRIDSSGNLLVGNTTTGLSSAGVNLHANGTFELRRDLGSTNVSTVGFISRGSTDGNILTFYKDTTAVGSIGANGGYIYVGSGNTNLRFHNGVPAMLPATSGGASRDNAIDLGSSGARFNDAFITNGVTTGSDGNDKQDIRDLTEAEQRVAVVCKGLLKAWRWKSAVEEKGDDARIHCGIIAQDLQAAFAAEGLDAGRYAMFMSNTWWETQTEVPAVEAVAEVLDEDGNVVTEAVEAADAYTRTDTYDTQEEAPEGATERTRLGVRYSELLAFIIGAL